MPAAAAFVIISPLAAANNSLQKFVPSIIGDMKSFEISAADDGQRLSRFIEKCVPGLPGPMMYRYIRKKRIKVNGRRCEASTRLRAGDLVEMYINDELFSRQRKLPDFMGAAKGLSPVYEDERMAVLYKPAGLLVHDDDGRMTRDTLINRFLRYLFEKGEYQPREDEAFTPALCNRLDRGTAGLVLAAKDRESLAELDRMVKQRLIDKRYLAVSVGRPPKDGLYRAFLLKDAEANSVRVGSRELPGWKPIATGVRLLARRGELNLLEVELVTGRTHQIRAHLAYLGSPLLGDGKYGIGEINRRYRITRQARCAYKLTFHPGDGSSLAYLEGRAVAVDRSLIWFLEEYFKGADYELS